PRASYLMLPVPDGSRVDLERAVTGRGDPPDGTDAYDGWALFSGTSAAAPRLAGAAAVLREINPDATPAEIAQVLCDTATDVRAGRRPPRFDYHAEIGPDLATGHGLVNVSAAAARLAGIPPVTPGMPGLVIRGLPGVNPPPAGLEDN